METVSLREDNFSVDTQIMENVVDDQDTLHAEWDDVCTKMMNDPEPTPYRENLEKFLFGIKKLETARASLQTTYETVHTSLQKILENALAAAVPIHELDSCIMSQSEMELLELFRYNHQLRKSMLQSLNIHNQSWETKYRNYISRILESVDGQCTVIGTPQGNTNVAQGTTNHNHQESGSNVKKEDCTDIQQFPLDWDEMIQLNPSSHVRIEAFLEGCDRWNAACNTLSCSFDELRQTIETHHTLILQIVESAYSRINDDLLDVQEKIQGYITTNNRRRTHIEQSLEELVQRQQSIFSRLMARVVGNTGTSLPWKRNATE